jgi:hypothetical protein
MSRIVDLYGRMVARPVEGLCDPVRPDGASFLGVPPRAEQPEVRIEKRPALRGRQGMWALIGENGMVLKRGMNWSGAGADRAAAAQVVNE